MESLQKSECPLSDEERRLLLEVMFAGVNHGLLAQVEGMIAVLPDLIPDPQQRTLCMAVLLAGLNQPQKAQQTLACVDLPEAEVMRAVVFPDPLRGVLYGRQ